MGNDGPNPIWAAAAATSFRPRGGELILGADGSDQIDAGGNPGDVVKHGSQ